MANSVSLQSSEDEGESFGRRLKQSNKSFDSRIGFGAKHGLADLGSRVALVSDDRRALAVWTDTRAGTQASNKQDLAHAVVGFSDPPRLSEMAQGALRYGGLALTLLGLAAIVLALVGARARSRRSPPERVVSDAP